MSDPNAPSSGPSFAPQQGAVATPMAPQVVRPCPNCGREFGDSSVCQACRQVAGLPRGILASSPGRRLGAALLDAALSVVTLVIGWVIWAVFTGKNGQSPAKSLLGLRVVKLLTGSPVGRGQLFVRWLVKRLFALIPLAWLIAALWLLWDKNRQALWDKVVETVVVDDPTGVLLQPSAFQAAPNPPGIPSVPPPPLQP